VHFFCLSKQVIEVSVKTLNLLCAALLLAGCASVTSKQQASIKIVAPPAGMYLKVGTSVGEGFELHPGDQDWEISRDPIDVIITPVLKAGNIVLGRADVQHQAGAYTKNQATCSMKTGYSATVELVDYQTATCTGNSRTLIQKGEVEASSVIFSFAMPPQRKQI
jgi:hypothetical protein